MEQASTTTLEIEYRESKVGNEVLVINGCRYMVNRRSGETVYWRCIYSWCNSRAVIKAGQLRSARGMHVCPQPLKQSTEETPESMKTNPGEITISPKNTISSLCMPVSFCQNPQLSSPLEVVLGNETQANGSKLEGSSVEVPEIPELADNISSGNNSFLELMEDTSTFQEDEDILGDKISEEDAAWKRRVLANLRVYSEAEQIRRLKIAYEIRKTWRDNKRQFDEKLSIRQKRWASTNVAWVYNQDWPTRSQCVKLTKPELGAGISTHQPEIPVKIIYEVILPIVENVTSSSATEEKADELLCDSKRSEDGTVSEFLLDKAYRPLRKEGKCPICNKIFQSSLERHMNVHYGIKPYTCKQCNKSFSQEHSYKAHCRLHTSERPFGCTICPKKFTSNGTLKRHVISHSSGRSFCCVTCGRRFRKAKFLDVHTSQCTGDYDHNFPMEKSSSTNPEGGSESENEVDQPPSSSSKPTWKRRRVISEYPEAEHGRILSLTREISMVERELDKRQSREMAKKREIEPRSGPRLFTLEELKYAEFLQPKVVLSKSLSLILSKTTLETRAPLQPNTTANTNTDPRPTHNCTFGC